MRFVTLNEEILMLSILRLGNEAYGVKIRELYLKITGKNIVMGTLYNSLDYLVKKGFIITKRGEPTPERGGKRKVYYSITEPGWRALKKTRELHTSAWQGIRDITFENR